MITDLAITTYDVIRSAVFGSGRNKVVVVELSDGEIKVVVDTVKIDKGDVSLKLYDKTLALMIERIVETVNDKDLQGHLIKGAFQYFLASSGVFSKLDEKPLRDVLKFLTAV